jgi:hypothetical protein
MGRTMETYYLPSCGTHPSWLALTHSSVNGDWRVQRVERRNETIELSEQTYAVEFDNMREVQGRTSTAALAKD